MTAKLRILTDVNTLLGEFIYDAKNEAERRRIEDTVAFKKAKARQKARSRIEAAITIQKIWRGKVGRLYYTDCLLKHFRQMSLQHYNSTVLKIQKVWRGYYVRRHVFDFYKWREYLEVLVEKNEHILSQLRQSKLERQWADFERARIIEEKHQRGLRRKGHHLLSTRSIPGIYNSPYRPGDNRDMLLRSVKFYRSSSPKKRKQLHLNTKVEKMRDSLKNLPDVPPKPQGPFRDPKEVRLQRYRPIRQTLRMETDFYHLERARQIRKDEELIHRHHDDIFMPVKYGDCIYQGDVVNRYSQYIPPGRSYPRQEDSSLNMGEKDFKLIVSPIPLFDVYRENRDRMEVKTHLDRYYKSEGSIK